MPSTRSRSLRSEAHSDSNDNALQRHKNGKQKLNDLMNIKKREDFKYNKLKIEAQADQYISAKHDNGKNITETAKEIDDQFAVPVSTKNTTDNATTSNVSVNNEEKNRNSSRSADFQMLLSGLYMDAAGRLCLPYSLRCAQDLSYCHSTHYCNPLPEFPYHTQAANLRCAWQQSRYVEFIQIATDMCTRSEFPGEGVFTKLIELILSTNYERNSKGPTRHAYISISHLFRLLVNTFPPCWLAMRPRYLNFFARGIDMTKFTSKSQEPISQSTKIFEIIFDLIEYTYEIYKESLKQSENAPPNTAKNSQYSMISVEHFSLKSQCFSQCNWLDNDETTAEFSTLKTDSRLERINVVLQLLLQILESNLVMWLLHYHRNPKETSFHAEKAPLVVLAFEMNAVNRLSPMVERLFTIFAKAIEMDLNRTHLQIIERYVSVIMVASHTADIENSIIGIKYPSLHTPTKDLIHDFYKIFKAHNTSSLSTYFVVIDLLRIPYVRFEFIDHFLLIFYHSATEPMSPGKIFNAMLRKVWCKYPTEEKIKYPTEELSREEYFALLLKALRSYCDMYGLQRVLRYLALNDPVKPLQTATDSVHRYPNRGRTQDVLILEMMAAEKNIWLKQLRMNVRMTRPKVDLPTVDICIDKQVLASYRNDLKQCWYLYDMIERIAKINTTIDFSEWLKFLKDFKYNGCK